MICLVLCGWNKVRSYKKLNMVANETEDCNCLVTRHKTGKFNVNFALYEWNTKKFPYTPRCKSSASGPCSLRDEKMCGVADICGGNSVKLNACRILPTKARDRLVTCEAETLMSVWSEELREIWFNLNSKEKHSFIFWLSVLKVFLQNDENCSITHLLNNVSY